MKRAIKHSPMLWSVLTRIRSSLGAIKAAQSEAPGKRPDRTLAKPPDA
jgi:hypothetical protein